MHAVAEIGHRSALAVQGQGRGLAGEAQRLGAMWLQSLLDIQDETRDAAEFLEHVKIDLVPRRGLRVHAQEQDPGAAARRHAGGLRLRDPLRRRRPHAWPPASTASRWRCAPSCARATWSEVVTAPGARPNPAWLNFVRTGRARSKIRHYLKNMEQEESRALGEKLLAQALRAEGLQHARRGDDAAAAGVDVAGSSSAGAATARERELLTDIATRQEDRHHRRQAGCRSCMVERGTRPDAVTTDAGPLCHDDAVPSHGDGDDRRQRRRRRCSWPPAAARFRATRIVGYLRPRRRRCWCTPPNATSAGSLFERDSERWMRCEWSEEPTRTFETAVTVLVRNGTGVLAQVASAVSAAQADITHIDMGEDRAAETTELRLLITGARPLCIWPMRCARSAAALPVLRVWRRQALTTRWIRRLVQQRRRSAARVAAMTLCAEVTASDLAHLVSACALADRPRARSGDPRRTRIFPSTPLMPTPDRR